MVIADWLASDISCVIKKFWSADLSKSLSVKTEPSVKSTNLVFVGVCLSILITAEFAGAEVKVNVEDEIVNAVVAIPPIKAFT
jgi:hypothetical protein